MTNKLKNITLKYSESEFEKAKIKNSLGISDYVRQFWHDDISLYESVFILLLNRNLETIGYSKISQGGVGGSIIDIKLIAKYAIDSLAEYVVLIHNHPSGNTKPSKEDITTTKIIKKGLRHLDIELLDHIIITREEYYSMADEEVI